MRIRHAVPSTDKENERFRLFVITDALNNFREGDILAYIGNLDHHTLGLFRVGSNNDEPALNARDTIALVANVFNFDSTLFALLDRWRLWRLLRLWGSVSVGCLIGHGCWQNSHTVGLVRL